MALAEAFALLAQLDREIWLLTACAGARRGGLIATFVSQTSIVQSMPRVLVGLARHHYTWELVEASGAFALHLLGEEHLEWVWRFGLQSGRDQDKFAGLVFHTAATGSPLLRDTPGWLDCRVEATLDSGDRSIYLAEVLDGHQAANVPPLTVKRLVQLAPPDKLQQLRELFNHDAAVDAAAIQEWRRKRASSHHKDG